MAWLQQLLVTASKKPMLSKTNAAGWMGILLRNSFGDVPNNVSSHKAWNASILSKPFCPANVSAATEDLATLRSFLLCQSINQQTARLRSNIWGTVRQIASLAFAIGTCTPTCIGNAKDPCCPSQYLMESEDTPFSVSSHEQLCWTTGCRLQFPYLGFLVSMMLRTLDQVLSHLLPMLTGTFCHQSGIFDRSGGIAHDLSSKASMYASCPTSIANGFGLFLSYFNPRVPYGVSPIPKRKLLFQPIKNFIIPLVPAPIKSSTWIPQSPTNFPFFIKV